MAAGKEFYVYVLQAVDPQKASVAGIKLRPTGAVDETPLPAVSPFPTKG